MAIHIKPVSFAVQDEPLRGDLFLPRGVARPAVVLMAQGFGGEGHPCQPEHAWHFAARGLAVLVFEHRPVAAGADRRRSLLDPERHLDDYAAALAFLRDCPDVDVRRIAVWGSSLGGGHALVTAARHPGEVRAVVAQVPHVDGACQAPAVPRPADLLPGRRQLRIKRYRPVLEARHIRCPVLLVASPGDPRVPFVDVLDTVRRIRHCRLELLAGGQARALQGPDFREQVQVQGSFLASTLARVRDNSGARAEAGRVS